MERLYDINGNRRRLVERWYEAGYYSKETFRDAMADGAARFADRRTIFYSEAGLTEYTARELYDRSHALAGALHRIGIRAGDVVAIQVPNWVEGNLILQAAMILGAVVLPVVHIYGAREVSYIVRQSQARLLVMPDRWRNIDYLERLAGLEDTPALEHVLIVGEDAPQGCIAWPEFESLATGDFPLADLHPDDLAMMLFTSGTTSDPKGVLHSHNTLMAELRAGRTGSSSSAAGMSLSPFPAGHIGGILGILGRYLTGSEGVLMDVWDAAAAAELIARYRVTSSSGTPYFVTSLLDAAIAGGHDISSLKSVVVGAANVPPEVVERCDRMGVGAFRSYGSSEHPTISGGTPDQPLEKRANTDGGLRPGCEVRIIDDDGNELPVGHEGEIAAIGPEQFLGYDREEFNVDAFLPDGWFKTGDIGRLDEEGYLTITDRKKDIIIRGGENIASKEVEDLLMRHPAVSEAAVVAMSDARLGETVCAYVVLEPDAQLSLPEVAAHFGSLRVAKQKIPERLIVADDLPHTASGKVKKFELRAALRAEFEAQEHS